MTEKAASVLQPTDDEARRLAATLIRTARYGALAVLDPSDRSPSASRVSVATDTDGAPVILISALAGHTAALLADPRCSLLLGEPGKGDPLAHPRITLAGRAERLEPGTADRERVARRYLNRHPKARLYAGFADFAFFRLEPLRASLNGGFGKAYALDRSDCCIDVGGLDLWSEAEQPAIDHMNADHRDAIAAYARNLAHAPEADWVIVAIDPDGFDIASGNDTRRIFFARRVESASELRSAFVNLTQGYR